MHCSIRTTQQNLLPEAVAAKNFKAKGQAPHQDLSTKGATSLVMFTGIMNAQCLGAVYEAGLLPFIQERFPVRHRLYQDNDPKHSSKYIENFLEQRGVNWWYTPPESPDLNSIELVWGSLKQYLRNHSKPKNLEELKAGIIFSYYGMLDYCLFSLCRMKS